MKNYTAIIERCPETGLYIGYVPGFSGAHTQAANLDELAANLREVIAMFWKTANRGAPDRQGHQHDRGRIFKERISGGDRK